MKDSFPREQAAHAGKFLLGIAALFLLFNYILSLIGYAAFENFYAEASLLVLKIFGLDGSVVAGEPALISLQIFSVPVGISYLCTGLLEMTVVWGAILASFGIPLRKRIIGAVAGAVVIAVFNIARIAASILIISFFGLDAGNFSHDLLFRVFLFLTVAGFYYFWFRWAQQDDAGTGKVKEIKKRLILGKKSV